MSTRQNPTVTANFSFAGVASLKKIFVFLILKPTRFSNKIYVSRKYSVEKFNIELPKGQIRNSGK
jgi:hypothetical protein